MGWGKIWWVGVEKTLTFRSVREEENSSKRIHAKHFIFRAWSKRDSKRSKCCRKESIKHPKTEETEKPLWNLCCSELDEWMIVKQFSFKKAFKDQSIQRKWLDRATFRFIASAFRLLILELYISLYRLQGPVASITGPDLDSEPQRLQFNYFFFLYSF